MHLEEQMDNLWHKLQEEVVSFKSSTEEKRRIYNDLLAKDKKGVAEVAENNKKIQKLMVRNRNLDISYCVIYIMFIFYYYFILSV